MFSPFLLLLSPRVVIVNVTIITLPAAARLLASPPLSLSYERLSLKEKKGKNRIGIASRIANSSLRRNRKHEGKPGKTCEANIVIAHAKRNASEKVSPESFRSLPGTGNIDPIIIRLKGRQQQKSPATVKCASSNVAGWRNEPRMN